MFPHLQPSGMLRQHMDDSYLREVPGPTVGFDSIINRPSVSGQRLRDCCYGSITQPIQTALGIKQLENYHCDD